MGTALHFIRESGSGRVNAYTFIGVFPNSVDMKTQVTDLDGEMGCLVKGVTTALREVRRKMERYSSGSVVWLFGGVDV